jgi:hypothetical protein
VVSTTFWYEKPVQTGLNWFFVSDRHFNAGRRIVLTTRACTRSTSSSGILLEHG